jgi:predicted DNA-binding transcriptional regulator YafY
MEVISTHDCDMAELVDMSGVNERLIKDSIKRLKEAGVPVRYSRKDDCYRLDWPSNPLKVELSPKALFLLKMAISSGKEVGEELELIDQVIESSDLLPIYDQGPAYGIGQGVQAELKEHFRVIQQARKNSSCLTFLYQPLNKEAEIRTVEPVYLYHTPVSWYLIGYCKDRDDFRSFKLARMGHLKASPLKSQDRSFDLKSFLGDSWWIQKGNEPVQVKVLFIGDAAKSILEYKYHASQSHEITSEGTIITWQLSYLGEFTSWLMQWMGQFKILSPPHLIQNVDHRIKRHQEKHRLAD